MQKRDLVHKSLLAVKNPNLVMQRLEYGMKRWVADMQYRMGRFNYPYQIIFIAGMPLSGTTWVKNLCGRIPGIFSRSTPIPVDVLYRQDICDSAFKYVPKNGNTLFKTHLNPSEGNISCIKNNGVEKVIVTYRDFRDALLSHYHRLIKFPKPKDAYDYVDYRLMSKEDAISELIRNYSKEEIEWIDGWFTEAAKNTGQYHFVRFEDLKKDVFGEFQKILDFYGIKLESEKITDIINRSRGEKNMEQNMKAAAILPFGISSNFRSGKIGSWREEFSEKNIVQCKEAYGAALIKFGYETNLDW